MEGGGDGEAQAWRDGPGQRADRQSETRLLASGLTMLGPSSIRYGLDAAGIRRWSGTGRGQLVEVVIAKAGRGLPHTIEDAEPLVLRQAHRRGRVRFEAEPELRPRVGADLQAPAGRDVQALVPANSLGERDFERPLSGADLPLRQRRLPDWLAIEEHGGASGKRHNREACRRSRNFHRLEHDRRPIDQVHHDHESARLLRVAYLPQRQLALASGVYLRRQVRNDARLPFGA